MLGWSSTAWSMAPRRSMAQPQPQQVLQPIWVTFAGTERASSGTGRDSAGMQHGSSSRRPSGDRQESARGSRDAWREGRGGSDRRPDRDGDRDRRSWKSSDGGSREEPRWGGRDAGAGRSDGSSSSSGGSGSWVRRERENGVGSDERRREGRFGQPREDWGGPRSNGGHRTEQRARFVPGSSRREEEDEEHEEEEEDWGQDGEGERGGRWGRERGGWRADGEEASGRVDTRKADLIGDGLYGVFPVRNALLANRRTCHTLYVLATLDLSKRKDAAAVRDVFAAAEAKGVPVVKVTRHELNLLSDDRPHQGLVLDANPLSWASPDLQLPPAADAAAAAAAAGRPPPVWVALDEVVDPQNFGAILRSAWCLGCAGLLVASKNCAPLSPAVSKASAGAMEVAPVHAAKNMQRTLADAVAKGWRVLGAAGESGAVDARAVVVDGPTILVMGSEGAGLRTNVRRACTALVRVEMGYGFTGGSGMAGAAAGAVQAPAVAANSDAAGSDGVAVQGGGVGEGEAAGTGGRPRGVGGKRAAVDSLNVSVAAGILLHTLVASAREHSTVNAVPVPGSN